MEEKNNPLSPHLQIYKWQISSLLSITHRIVGVINIIAINTMCPGRTNAKPRLKPVIANTNNNSVIAITRKPPKLGQP